MTPEEMQVAEVRMRLFAAAHGETLDRLEATTQVPRGTLAHALMAVPKVQEDPYGAGLCVFDFWLEWFELVKADAGGYENFAVYVRRKVQERKP